MRIRPPHHGTVVAYLALFVALGSAGAYAAATIGSADIKRNAVKARHVAPGQIKARHVAPGAVKQRQLAANAVRSAAIAREQVQRRHIAPGAVGPSELDQRAREGGGFMTANAAVPPLPMGEVVFVGFLSASQANPDEAAVQTLMPNRDLVLRAFRLRWIPSGVSQPFEDLVVTLRIDGENTQIECGLVSTQEQSCTPDEEVPVPAGSLLSLSVWNFNSLIVTSPGRLLAAVVLDPA